MKTEIETLILCKGMHIYLYVGKDEGHNFAEGQALSSPSKEHRFAQRILPWGRARTS